MDSARFAQVGALIFEKGQVLREKREQAAEVLKEIRALEDEVRPLLIEHTKLMAEMLGSIVPQIPVAQPQQYAPQAQQYTPPPQISAYPAHLGVQGLPPPIQHGREADPLRSRIRAFLQRSNSEDGLSANDVATQLGMDPELVREVIREQMRAR